MTYLTDCGKENWGDALQALIDTTDSIGGFCSLLDRTLGVHGGDLQPDAAGIASLLARQVEDLRMIEPILRREISRIRAEKLNVFDADLIARVTGARRQTVERVVCVATGVDLSTARERTRLEAEGGASRQIFDLVMSRTIAIDGFLEIVAEVAELPIEPLARAFSAAMFVERSDLETEDRAEYIADLKSSVADVMRSRKADDDNPSDDKETPKEKRDQLIVEMSSEGMKPADIAQAVNLKRSTVERVIQRLKGGSEENDAEPDNKAVNE